MERTVYVRLRLNPASLWRHPAASMRRLTVIVNVRAAKLALRRQAAYGTTGQARWPSEVS